jgi:hypothetical protein
MEVTDGFDHVLVDITPYSREIQGIYIASKKKRNLRKADWAGIAAGLGGAVLLEHKACPQSLYF